MVFRRCPQCGSTSDDAYGFCIKCGHEFPKIEIEKNTCPLCGFKNPDEADYCVKCGTPLLFKNQLENNSLVNPVVVKRSSDIENDGMSTMTKVLIFAGYVFSILGGVLGIIIAVYLSTRKDPKVRRHGHIQIAIFVFYIALIAILYFTGNIPAEAFSNYTQLLNGNFSGI